MLWNICAILEDELMRAKVGWEMLWVHAFDRFIGEYATTHACLFPYASDKILYARSAVVGIVLVYVNTYARKRLFVAS